MAEYQLAFDGAEIDQKLARLDTLLEEFESLHASFQAMLGDNDETAVIDTMKEMKRFFAGTQNTATVKSVKEDAVKDVMDNVATVADLDSLFQ